jgi:hypothetical protein
MDQDRSRAKSLAGQLLGHKSQLINKLEQLLMTDPPRKREVIPETIQARIKADHVLGNLRLVRNEVTVSRKLAATVHCSDSSVKGETVKARGDELVTHVQQPNASIGDVTATCPATEGTTRGR